MNDANFCLLFESALALFRMRERFPYTNIRMFFFFLSSGAFFDDLL